MTFGSRQLHGLDLNNVLVSGRGGRPTRSSVVIPSIPEEPPHLIDAKKDALEIKQHLLNMHITGLGDMSEEEKRGRVAWWILHYDKPAKKQEAKPVDANEDKDKEQQQPADNAEAKNQDNEGEEQKQPAEDKKGDAEVEQPDNTANGEDEPPKKTSPTEETSPTKETSPTEETSPMEEISEETDTNPGNKDDDIELSDDDELSDDGGQWMRLRRVFQCPLLFTIVMMTQSRPKTHMPRSSRRNKRVGDTAIAALAGTPAPAPVAPPPAAPLAAPVAAPAAPTSDARTARLREALARCF